MSNTLTASQLASSPLQDLLARLHVDLVEVDISDPRFFGSLVRGSDGPLLAMPPGRPEGERDTVARILIGKWAGVPLPRPASVELTVLDD